VPVGQVLALEALLLKPMPLTKRLIDVTGALVGLTLLSPLLLLIAALIKLTSPGPVLFTQWRSGRGGRRFRILKFRTMVADAENRKAQLRELNEQDGPAFKIKKDPRITWVGRILRTTSLDELPQLWNVLVGHMSLVGPRPLPCEETDNCKQWQRRRLDVTPGLTCIWQVRGRSSVSFYDWVRMDVEYIRRQSTWQDLKLLLLTVPAVLLHKGAH
jgi:lipopolysaccharide/colanic/teichoic acid biosynthesis glycosyltransferase